MYHSGASGSFPRLGRAWRSDPFLLGNAFQPRLSGVMSLMFHLFGKPIVVGVVCCVNLPETPQENNALGTCRPLALISGGWTDFVLWFFLHIWMAGGE